MEQRGDRRPNRNVNYSHMKNLLNILFVLLGVMVSIASCHRVDTPYDDIPQDETGASISFSHINASLETKTDGSGSTTAPSISSFKVWASRTYGSGDNQNTNYSIFGGDIVEYDSDNRLWEYSPVRYWQPGTYDFIAVSQYPDGTAGTLSADGLSLTFGTDGWDLNTDTQDLLLAATPNVSGDTRFNVSSPSAVDLAFNHQLALVKFSAKNVDARDVTISIKSISVQGNQTTALGFKYIGTSAPQVTTWTLDNVTPSQNIPLILEEGKSSIMLDKNSPKDLTSGMVVFPQTCTLEIEISYDVVANGGTATNTKSASRSISWSSGKIYEYSINITSDHISFGVEPTVIDWKTAEFTDSDSEITM